MIHFLIGLIILLAILGVLMWMAKSIPGIPPWVINIIIGIVVIIFLIWLYNQFEAGSFAVDFPPPHR